MRVNHLSDRYLLSFSGIINSSIRFVHVNMTGRDTAAIYLEKVISFLLIQNLHCESLFSRAHTDFAFSRLELRLGFVRLSILDTTSLRELLRSGIAAPTRGSKRNYTGRQSWSCTSRLVFVLLNSRNHSEVSLNVASQTPIVLELPYVDIVE